MPFPASPAPQAESVDTQAVRASPSGSAQAGTDTEAISVPPLASQSGPRHPRQALMPRHPVLSPGPPMTTHWKIPAPNGSSTCLANL